MTDNFLNLMKNISIHIEEAQQTASKKKYRKSTFRHKIVILKAKDKILGQKKEGYLHTKRTP